MKYRRWVLALCVLLTAAAVFSLAYLAEGADHTCAGEGCHVCRHLTAARSLLAQLGCALLASAGLAAVTSAAGARRRLAAAGSPRSSLVCLEVRRNN
ncbi:MAG: hypothetical protein LBK75_04955 [Oscillospiraceae bacterium]|nr:hypothetical protein [Oscillospiraceae bacterium]